MNKKTVYSGIQPTGCITLGNYIGAVSNWLKLQEDENYQCVYSIVDLHSLTVRQNPAEFRARALSFFAQYLALGLDPNKNIMYFQSHVSAHTELTWVLDCFAYVGEMGRMTQFKEKSAKHEDNVNVGLLNYPVLMASDILLYNTDIVPIGIDQKQHLEIARDLAIRFNNLFSPTFVVPEAYYPKVGAKIMSLQNPSAKMSKSDEDPNATIALVDDNATIMRKIRRAVTDSDNKVAYDMENKPGISNLLTIYSACKNLSIEQAVEETKDLNYGEFKEKVGIAVVELLVPFKQKYSELMNNKEYLLEIAKEGAIKANKMAQKTLRKVYKKIGLVQI